MTDSVDPAPEVAAASAPKATPPGLSMRAPRPQAVRLRKSVVQALVIGGATLVSGALVWAFIIQPELRQSARDRQAEAGQDRAIGAVRPAEAVTEQPATYDRLPEPRGALAAEPAPQTEDVVRPRDSAVVPRPTYERAAVRSSGPTPRQLAERSGLFFGHVAARTMAPAAEAPPARDDDRRAAGDALYGAQGLMPPRSPYELKAGALVSAALLTAVDTARTGPVVATVTQNVYDTVSGRYLLVPQGTRLIGRAGGDSAYGDRRAFLTWERMILPNGKSLILTEEAGVDAQGAIGVRGEVDRRLLPLLVATAFSGAITTLGQIARDDGDTRSGSLLGDAGDAAAIEGARIGGRLIDRELDVRPSIRLRPGSAVRVLITRDLILEPYAP